jgi:pyrroloquinoline quinone (PQQ) biosynthesis protein C
MAPDGSRLGNGSIADQIVAIRDRWHTKKHPFFQAMTDGSLDLRALGVYMANHFQFVSHALPAFGLMYYRAPKDVRDSLVENMAEEQGLMAIPGEGHEAHDHNEMIFCFCAAAGLDADAVRSTKMSPAWIGRTLHYVHCLREEPIGVALAMQSTQEGQQVDLNNEITIPAFQAHYGFALDAPEIGFFVEHAEADLEHSRRQIELCEKHLDSDEKKERAIEVCEEAVRLRWESITDLHRRHVLNDDALLPPGVAA